MDWKGRRKVAKKKIQEAVQAWIVPLTMDPGWEETWETVWKSRLIEAMKKIMAELKLELELLFPILTERKDFVWDIISDAVSNFFLQMRGVWFSNRKAAFSIKSKVEHIDEVILAKQNAIDFLQIRQQQLFETDPSLNEDSSIGLIELRHALAPPYLKTADGLVSAPAAFKASNEYEDAFFSRNKKKWTGRDIEDLKDCILFNLKDEMLQRVRSKHDELMEKCSEVEEEENTSEEMRKIHELGSDYKPPPSKRGRGRPAVVKIFPNLLCLEELKIQYTTDGFQISEWFKNQQDRIENMEYKDLFIASGATAENIDWSTISNHMTVATKKYRTARDCQLAFKFEANPSINAKALSVKEQRQVEAMAKKHEWAELSTKIGREEFRTFFTWKNSSSAQKIYKQDWTAEKDRKLCQLTIELKGNWIKIASEIDASMNKEKVFERFKKTKNPLLRFGDFSRVEDCLLMLTIEKLKGHLNKENNFAELTAYLPWRNESTWRDRAETLFFEGSIPWTLEEDQKLIDLVGELKNDWTQISENFTSSKSRKGCLTRYNILLKGIKKNGGLEEYHRTYSRIRYSIRSSKNLDEVLVLLKKVFVQKRIRFYGIKPGRPPTESEPLGFLLSYNKMIMESTIKSIEKYLEFRNGCKQSIFAVPKKNEKHDRRVFHRNSPQSVASALHIRGLKLKKDFGKHQLSVFQKEIVESYAQFGATKPLKADRERPYLPDEAQLIRLPEVGGLLDLNPRQEEILRNRTIPIPTSGNPVPRCRGRPRKIILEELLDFPRTSGSGTVSSSANPGTVDPGSIPASSAQRRSSQAAKIFPEIHLGSSKSGKKPT